MSADKQGCGYVQPEVPEELQCRFMYHPPKGDQVERYAALRGACLTLAMLIEESCPMSREKALAVTKLEEVNMWANAAIARRE